MRSVGEKRIPLQGQHRMVSADRSFSYPSCWRRHGWTAECTEPSSASPPRLFPGLIFPMSRLTLLKCLKHLVVVQLTSGAGIFQRFHQAQLIGTLRAGRLGSMDPLLEIRRSCLDSPKVLFDRTSKIYVEFQDLLYLIYLIKSI